MSRELRLCPGVGGRKCGAVLSSWDRDPHPTCTRCRGKICTKDMTCDFCVGWSPSQWEALFPLLQRLLLVRGLLRKSCALRPLPLPSLQEGRLRGGGLGMHLVLRPVRLPLLPLDLGPARGVEVFLVARPVRANALLPPRLLQELGRGRLLVRSGRPPARAASSVASPCSSQHALQRGESGESLEVRSRSRSFRVSQSSD